MARTVFLISDWPENLGEEVKVLDIKPGESDEEAIARAQTLYSAEDEFIVRDT